MLSLLGYLDRQVTILACAQDRGSHVITNGGSELSMRRKTLLATLAGTPSTDIIEGTWLILMHAALVC